jgi:hypothetical protein
MELRMVMVHHVVKHNNDVRMMVNPVVAETNTTLIIGTALARDGREDNPSYLNHHPKRVDTVEDIPRKTHQHWL